MPGEYFNTTHQTGGRIVRFRQKTQAQDLQILEFFESNPRDHYTPSDILLFVFENSCPITSVRRAITGLTNEGQLIKTDHQKDGPYGRPEYCWRLASGQLELL